ncbi:RNA chaperone Hfq [Clostridium argentinense CDC 2741]|uniref:RNA-binding protein Hfq n=1 Tax=Clostridium argentinense CDC 2741 TaxID=1418104 RepID=A0A0C1RCN9_9CLOT|nr:RNA chaperone Hfq [Clostridium argentinense]ARC85177.1 RNA-binding protein Hfq [Clostridium argentinense]KIE48131.1 RNA chaperone Hfq [Clostridium argentinense CDC 2741]NFF39520.1 RNA chaperone Hfq [Clostridium argentinense]NFP50933.1 RNA chaperone Hfq [Clostridium argentinense]NFP73673.1 RNA chaperone Hfq [Clostridium argentinense]
MSKSTNNLQDIFLNGARKNKVPVTIHLTNGFQIKGNVTGFDSFTVVLYSDGKQMLIYKHAISTITPLKPILFNNSNENSNED